MVKKTLLLLMFVVILLLVSCVNYPPGNPHQGDEWITEGELVGLSVTATENTMIYHLFVKYSPLLTYDWTALVLQDDIGTIDTMNKLQEGKRYTFKLVWLSDQKTWTITDIEVIEPSERS